MHVHHVYIIYMPSHCTGVFGNQVDFPFLSPDFFFSTFLALRKKTRGSWVVTSPTAMRILMKQTRRSIVSFGWPRCRSFWFFFESCNVGFVGKELYQGIGSKSFLDRNNFFSHQPRQFHRFFAGFFLDGFPKTYFLGGHQWHHQVALWTQWHYLGDLVSSDVSRVASLDVQGFCILADVA